MPFSINGTFTIINSFSPNTPILSADVDADFTDIASGLTTLWARTTSLIFKSRVFTASDVYVPTTGMLSAIIEEWGAGAGGGSSVNAPAGQTTVGGGGGAGGYSRKIVTVGDIGASKVVTIGVAGLAGISGGNGGDGGDTSVGVLCIALGGHGGRAGVSANAGNGGLGANAGTGDDAARGMAGFAGSNGIASTSDTVIQGTGGSTLLGDGGQGVVSAGLGLSFKLNGAPGNGNGAGGAGGMSVNNGGASNGGPGSAGYVRITELVGPT